MTQQRTPTLHSATFWGIACGLSMAVWVLIEFALGFHTTSLDIGRYSGYFSTILPITFIYVALAERQSFLDRKLPILDGITIGFRIALFSALILSVFLIVYNKFINPEWIELTVDWQRKQMILNGASNDDIARFIELNRHLNSVPGQFFAELISGTGLGVLITVVEIPAVRFFSAKRRHG